MVAVLAFFIRLKLIFSTDLPFGTDGAYYIVQVRKILQTGLLGFSDFPLFFYIQAFISKIISLFIVQSQAIIIGTRITDTVLPILILIPVYLFSAYFIKESKNKKVFFIVVFFASIVSVLNPNLMEMAGNLQKNSFAMSLCLFYFYFIFKLVCSIEEKKEIKKYSILSAIFLFLINITHFGTGLLSIIFTIIFFIIYFFQGKNKKEILKIVILIIFILLLAFSIIYFYDSARILKIIYIINNPGRLFINSFASQLFKGIFIFNELPLGVLSGNIMGVLGLIIFFIYKDKTKVEKSLIFTCSILSLFLSSPFLGSEWVTRLALMSFLPALIPLIYFSCKDRKGTLLIVIVAIVIFTNGMHVANSQQMTMSKEGLNDITLMKQYMVGSNNLILTAHGLEWWSAWATNEEVTSSVKDVVSNWRKYDNIYILQQTDPKIFKSPNNLDSSNNSLIIKNIDFSKTILIHQGQYFKLLKIID